MLHSHSRNHKISKIFADQNQIFKATTELTWKWIHTKSHNDQVNQILDDFVIKVKTSFIIKIKVKLFLMIYLTENQKIQVKITND